MKKFLKIVSHATLTLLFVLYIAYQFRTDPIGILAGKKVTGEEVSYPADWSFSDEHMLIAVESRPGNPHSVTTVCFVHEGDLYVPAREGSTKDWPSYVLADNRVRLKIGEKIYPAAMERVTAMTLVDMGPSLAKKYPQFADATPEDIPPDTWLFKVIPR